MVQDSHRSHESDLLRIGDDLLPDIDEDLDRELRKGVTQRVMILRGTEGPAAGRKPYAQTKARITFSNERDLRQCVRLLRWSDERLRLRPEQLVLWEWSSSFREGMTISFGVNWYDKEFFETRKDVFKNPEHRGYYAMFGASADDFELEHVVLKK